MESRRTYEAMFLVDSGNSDFEAASAPIRTILNRYEAEVLALRPWDERRLAYEIAHRKRGLYVLSYFKADPLRIVEMERDCQLDERIIRVLVLSRERLTEDEINAATPIQIAQKRASEVHTQDAAAGQAERAEGVEVPDVPDMEEIDDAAGYEK